MEQTACVCLHQLFNFPLEHQFMRVWVDVAKAPGAYLFRPNHEMLTIGEAVGSTFAWPTEKVITVVR